MIERFAQMPSALRTQARWERITGAVEPIPVMLVHPEWASDHSAPLVLWMHGRTAHKELDPGRYLRWMRAGIAACAIDLPGHGERFDDSLQSAATAFDLIVQSVREIDDVLASLRAQYAEHFDFNRTAIGGMSLGGMAALARLTTPHPFACASVEATTGWFSSPEKLKGRGRAAYLPEAALPLDPYHNLERWREIPLQAIHARHDEWVSFASQSAFIDALRARYRDPELIDFIIYDETGAPHEHIGFGEFAADAKDRQRNFFRRWLIPER